MGPLALTNFQGAYGTEERKEPFAWPFSWSEQPTTPLPFLLSLKLTN